MKRPIDKQGCILPAKKLARQDNPFVFAQQRAVCQTFKLCMNRAVKAIAEDIHAPKDCRRRRSEVEDELRFARRILPALLFGASFGSSLVNGFRGHALAELKKLDPGIVVQFAPLLLALIRCGNSSTRCSAFHALRIACRKVPNQQELLQTTVIAVDDPNPWVRLAMVQVLRELALTIKASHLLVLVTLLKDEEPFVRRTALHALCNLRHYCWEPAHLQLLECLRNQLCTRSVLLSTSWQHIRGGSTEDFRRISLSKLAYLIRKIPVCDVTCLNGRHMETVSRAAMRMSESGCRLGSMQCLLGWGACSLPLRAYLVATAAMRWFIYVLWRKVLCLQFELQCAC